MLSDDFISDVLHRLPLSEILESCAYSCALKQNVCAKGAANTEGTGLGLQALILCRLLFAS